jgi:hypothetical protein
MQLLRKPHLSVTVFFFFFFFFPSGSFATMFPLLLMLALASLLHTVAGVALIASQYNALMSVLNAIGLCTDSERETKILQSRHGFTHKIQIAGCPSNSDCPMFGASSDCPNGAYVSCTNGFVTKLYDFSAISARHSDVGFLKMTHTTEALDLRIGWRKGRCHRRLGH